MLGIGSVVFWRGGQHDAAPVMGEERIGLLRALYRGEPLGLFQPRADFSTGNRPITRDEVDWDTASERVTGRLPEYPT